MDSKEISSKNKASFWPFKLSAHAVTLIPAAVGINYVAKAFAEGLKLPVCLVTRLLQKRVARGKTVIMITHDMDWLAENCQEVYAMSQGQLVYHGPVHQLFSDQAMLDRLGLLPAKSWQLSQLIGLKPEVLSLK